MVINEKKKPFQNSFSIVAWDVQCVTHWTFIISPPVTWEHASLHLIHVYVWHFEFVEDNLAHSGGLISERERSSKRHLLLQWPLRCICEELLLCLNFIALLPLNLEERPKLSATRRSPRAFFPPKKIQKLASSSRLLIEFGVESLSSLHINMFTERKSAAKNEPGLGFWIYCWGSFSRPGTLREWAQVQMQQKKILKKLKRKDDGGEAFHMFTGHTAFLTFFCKEKLFMKSVSYLTNSVANKR